MFNVYCGVFVIICMFGVEVNVVIVKNIYFDNINVNGIFKVFVDCCVSFFMNVNMVYNYFVFL